MSAQVIPFRSKPKPPPKEAVDCMKKAASLIEQANDLIDKADRLCFEAGTYPPDFKIRPRPKPYRA